MFNKQNFCHVASNNRNEQKAGLFVYKTTDDLATVATSGYFNEKIIDINLHDLIIHEWHDPADRTKVQRNILCVVERTLENVGTIVIKSKWEGDIEQAIENIQQQINNLDQTFLKLDGTNTMTGPLKMRSSVSFKCAIAPSWDGVGFYKLNDNDSLTLMASMESIDGLTPAQNNTYNIGKASHKWKNAYVGKVFTAVLNNGYDIAVPVTDSADTLALKSDVDLAANSGRMITDQGVWFAKMYAGTTAPAADNGTNYADFSQVDGDGNPIIVIYERQSGAWVQTQTVVPPANYDGYVPVTKKIWDIVEQTGQNGGRILWNHQSKEFTPYPSIISFEDIEVTGDSTVIMPGSPSPQQIVNMAYVDDAITNRGGAFQNIDVTFEPSDLYLPYRNEEGDISAVNSTCHIILPGSFDFVDQTARIMLVVEYTQAPTTDSLLFYCPTGTASDSIQLNITSSGTLSLNGHDGSTVLQANTKYYIRIDKSSGTHYEVYLSTDGTNFTQEIAFFATLTLTISKYKIQLLQYGILHSAESYISIENHGKVWTGIGSTGLYQRADTDLSNLSAIGKEYIAHQAMPAGYIDLTWAASGALYTAPADGYINVARASTGANQALNLWTGVNISSFSTASGQTMRVFAPISKGESFSVSFSSGTTATYLRFVYANGAK